MNHVGYDWKYEHDGALIVQEFVGQQAASHEIPSMSMEGPRKAGHAKASLESGTQ